jgi:CMP-2-keto-3-deoxyoctulosonic acid synthetase
MKGRERKKEITQKIVSEGDHSLLNISTDITLVDSNIIKLVLYLLFEREAHFSFFPFFPFFFLSQVLSYDFFFFRN